MMRRPPRGARLSFAVLVAGRLFLQLEKLAQAPQVFLARRRRRFAELAAVIRVVALLGAERIGANRFHRRGRIVGDREGGVFETSQPLGRYLAAVGAGGGGPFPDRVAAVVEFDPPGAPVAPGTDVGFLRTRLARGVGTGFAGRL